MYLVFSLKGHWRKRVIKNESIIFIEDQEIPTYKTYWLVQFYMACTTSYKKDTVVILEEGNQTYPRCSKCDMFVPHKALNGQHLMKALCRRGEERKWCHLYEEEEQAGT